MMEQGNLKPSELAKRMNKVLVGLCGSNSRGKMRLMLVAGLILAWRHKFSALTCIRTLGIFLSFGPYCTSCI